MSVLEKSCFHPVQVLNIYIYFILQITSAKIGSRFLYMDFFSFFPPYFLIIFLNKSLFGRLTVISLFICCTCQVHHV